MAHARGKIPYSWALLQLGYRQANRQPGTHKSLPQNDCSAKDTPFAEKFRAEESLFIHSVVFAAHARETLPDGNPSCN
jgi:hypothetical protein